MFSEFRKQQTEKTTSVCLLQTENGNGKLPFLCCKRKQKTEVVVPWSTNGNRGFVETGFALLYSRAMAFVYVHVQCTVTAIKAALCIEIN
jgi:hypothetical protein